MRPNNLSTYFRQLKHKKLLLISAALSLISLLYIFSVSAPSRPPSSSPPPPQKLMVINASPSSPHASPSILSFLFNQPVALNQIQVKLSPSTPFTLFLTTDSSTLFIQPNQPWKLNVEYDIVISDKQDTVLYNYKVTFVDPNTINIYPPDKTRPQGI